MFGQFWGVKFLQINKSIKVVLHFLGLLLGAALGVVGKGVVDCTQVWTIDTRADKKSGARSLEVGRQGGTRCKTVQWRLIVALPGGWSTSQFVKAGSNRFPPRQIVMMTLWLWGQIWRGGDDLWHLAKRICDCDSFALSLWVHSLTARLGECVQVNITISSLLRWYLLSSYLILYLILYLIIYI